MLADNGDRARLAAEETPEVHWGFVNTAGEVFTAASAEELQRTIAVLAPVEWETGIASVPPRTQIHEIARMARRTLGGGQHLKSAIPDKHLRHDRLLLSSDAETSYQVVLFSLLHGKSSAHKRRLL
jgi:hypothetical protein